MIPIWPNKKANENYVSNTCDQMNRLDIAYFVFFSYLEDSAEGIIGNTEEKSKVFLFEREYRKK